MSTKKFASCFFIMFFILGGTSFAIDLNNFAITVGTYSETDNLEQAVLDEFGANYRIADWNDIVAYHDAGGNAVDFEAAFTNGAMITYNGEHWYNSYRHYFYTISHRPGQTPHDGYLSHANIDNHEFDLGSWYGLDYHILVYTDNPNECLDCDMNGDGVVNRFDIRDYIRTCFGRLPGPEAKSYLEKIEYNYEKLLEIYDE